MIVPIVMALLFIGIRAVTLIINDLRTADDRAYHPANDRARRSRNDRSCAGSDCRAREGTIIVLAFFGTRRRRKADQRGCCRDGDMNVFIVTLSFLDAFAHRAIVASRRTPIMLSAKISV
jgi:hypothetical protein